MRPHINDIFMNIAMLLSQRTTCIRRGVGCVLVNEYDHILSTGYNGAPRGMPHCIDSECKRENKHGEQSFDSCIAVHAEENAMLQCPDAHKIVACYVTKFPCARCLRMLMNTSCKKIFFIEEHNGTKELLTLCKLKGITCYRLLIKEQNETGTTTIS